MLPGVDAVANVPMRSVVQPFSLASGSAIVNKTLVGIVMAGGLTADVPNNVVQNDGTNYPFTIQGIKNAVAAACNGKIPGKVVLLPAPAGPKLAITEGFSPPSGCTISGPGKDRLVLQAAVGFKGKALITLSGVSHVRLEGFGVDGSLVTGIDGIDLDNTPTDIVIQNVYACNFLPTHVGGNAIGVSSGGTDITIQDSEICGSGSSISAPAGSGLSLSPGVSSSLTHVKVLRNRVHDNTNGIILSPGTSTSALVEDVVFAENTIYANGDDGIAVFGFKYPHGPMRGIRAENNEAYCNGWPGAVGGFSSNCTAGRLQIGDRASATGVGIDINSSAVVRPVVVGNNTHDNVYDGIAVTNQLIAKVNTKGKALTCPDCGTSYPPLNVGWQSGQWVSINGAYYQISACASATACTLRTSAGVQTNKGFLGPSSVNGTIAGNVSNHNGNPCCGGTGIYTYFSDGNAVTGNTASFNAMAGISAWDSSFNTFTNNTAISNNQSNKRGNHGGFLVNLGLNDSFAGNVAEDRAGAGSKFQSYGLVIGENTTNTYVESSGLTGPNGSVADYGTGTRIRK